METEEVKNPNFEEPPKPVKKKGRPPLDPAQRLMTLQKNIRIPVDINTKLDIIRSKHRHFTNNYVITAILRAVLDRIESQCETMRIISLDEIKVYL